MASTDSGRAFVRYALKVGALELLPKLRKLKSGRMSPHFFNSANFTQAAALAQLAGAYAAAIAGAVRGVGCEGFMPRPDVIFGPAYKGIQLATATALELARSFTGFEGVEIAHDRKEVKDHGEGGRIVGANLRGKYLALVDDVTTTGTSLGDAAKLTMKEGGVPIGFFIGFDRMERGWYLDNPNEERPAAQILRDTFNVPVIAAANLDDLLQVLEEDTVPLGAETLPLILKYRDQYGV